MIGDSGLTALDLRLRDPVVGPAALRELQAITAEISHGRFGALNEPCADPDVKARKLQAVSEAFAAVGIE